MSRIAPIEREQAAGPVRSAFEEGLSRWGRMTNMKRTLLHSLPAYHALMQWYALFDVVKAFLGEHLAIIFAHSVSAGTECLICTTYMRRILIEWGENPDALQLDTRAETLVAFGRALTQPGHRVPDDLFQRVTRFFTSEQIVALTAFGALMVATNIINNALAIDLDAYLYEYRERRPAKRGENGT